MNDIYHRIFINGGEPMYRVYNEALNEYEHEWLTEQELIEILLDDVVEDEIELNDEKLYAALRRIPNHHDRELIEMHLRYLERTCENE